mmetsp:Transcript_31733/g.101152  ORF Transcript_31733/g.101152 Transcript_31733/m.101152 type:complete len:420 (+) Transcript_31733:850-2109(+)
MGVVIVKLHAIRFVGFVNEGVLPRQVLFLVAVDLPLLQLLPEVPCPCAALVDIEPVLLFILEAQEEGSLLPPRSDGRNERRQDPGDEHGEGAGNEDRDAPKPAGVDRDFVGARASDTRGAHVGAEVCKVRRQAYLNLVPNAASPMERLRGHVPPARPAPTGQNPARPGGGSGGGVETETFTVVARLARGEFGVVRRPEVPRAGPLVEAEVPARELEPFPRRHGEAGRARVGEGENSLVGVLPRCRVPEHTPGLLIVAPRGGEREPHNHRGREEVNGYFHLRAPPATGKRERGSPLRAEAPRAESPLPHAGFSPVGPAVVVEGEGDGRSSDLPCRARGIDDIRGGIGKAEAGIGPWDGNSPPPEDAGGSRPRFRPQEDSDPSRLEGEGRPTGDHLSRLRRRHARRSPRCHTRDLRRARAC